MGTPNVNVSKSDGNTGVTQPATTGVLAIIAFVHSLVPNQAFSFTKQGDILSQGGLGPGLEYSAYYINTAKKPVLLISPSCSTAGLCGTVDVSKVTGTSVITATGAPFDDYDVVWQVLTGGTIGTIGITYQYSLDNGNTFYGPFALGTATTLVLNVQKPAAAGSTGATLNFAAGTLIAGDRVRFQTSRPKMTNADLVTALEVLRTTAIPWDNVLIDTDATSTMVATVDSWLSGLEAVGRYAMAWMNTRHKNTPVPGTESEAAYLTALTTLAINATSPTIRVDVGADGGYSPSNVTGLLQVRPTSLAIATRTNPLAVGIDPAWIALNPIPGFQLTDPQNPNTGPAWHDEQVYPGIDALKLSTLRSVPGRVGTYINNANICSPTNSDFVYDQHARVSNVACGQAFQLYQPQLSRGLRKGQPDPTTGKVYALGTDLDAIDGDVNTKLAAALENQVTNVQATLHRDDDVSSNAGAFLNADINVEALAYIKGINAVQKFVKSITRTIQIPLAS